MVRRWLLPVVLLTSILTLLLIGCGGGSNPDEVTPQAIVTNMVVVAFNELGMHCMNKDFSKLMILPPYNTLRAQVIRRGAEPEIVQSGVSVTYKVPSSTHSADKTNFWTYAAQLLGNALAPNVGLTGNRLSGSMASMGDGRYEVTGIPVTPITDAGKLNPYQLANVVVKAGGVTTATTRAVLPVSWEISCNLCHSAPGGADLDILRTHDRLHETALVDSLPLSEVSYTSSASEAERAVASGEATAAFLVRPPTVEQVEEFARAGARMPPKSTYFFPKLTSGLLLSPLDE